MQYIFFSFNSSAFSHFPLRFQTEGHGDPQNCRSFKNISLLESSQLCFRNCVDLVEHKLFSVLEGGSAGHL